MSDIKTTYFSEKKSPLTMKKQEDDAYTTLALPKTSGSNELDIGAQPVDSAEQGSFNSPDLTSEFRPKPTVNLSKSKTPTTQMIRVQIDNTIEMEGDFHFTLSNIPTCFANALRRTIITDIPVCVIRSENEEVNQCNFEINTSRLHNEILKQRLSCIPIHIKDLDLLKDKYILEVDVQNNTDELMFVTTEQFRIKNKETGNYTTKEQTHEIFPPDPVTHYYIDLCRLRPKISDAIPGEHVKFSAEFSVSTAKVNSMFNVVSKCTYCNTLDKALADKEWSNREKKLHETYSTITNEEIAFEKRNFELLDAQGYFVKHSFDYTIHSIGIYDNIEIIKKALVILQNKVVDFVQALIRNEIPINKSATTMDHCYDIVLEDEDSTLGRILEYLLYQRFYEKEKTLSFCGFKKIHPHHTESILRLAFTESVEKDQIRYILKESCLEAEQILKQMYGLF